VNILIVIREVIDDAKRYIPQPTFRNSLFLNVNKDRTLLIEPPMNIMIAKVVLVFTKND
jgi:hypothetical protein